jgi:hypothetical protein
VLSRSRTRRDPHAHFVEAPGPRLSEGRWSFVRRRPSVRSLPLVPLLDVMIGVTLVLLTQADTGAA